MADEQDVHLVAVFRGDQGLEKAVGGLGVEAGGDPPEPAGDAVDVGVDGEKGHAEGKEEDAADGLGADAVKAAEAGLGGGRGHAPEELERDAATVGVKLAENRLDARGFEAREASDADGLFELLDGGVGDGLPRGETAAEAAVGGGGVGVAGVLREDGFDEDVDAVAPAAEGFFTVGAAEAPEDLAHGGGRSSGGGGHGRFRRRQ